MRWLFVFPALAALLIGSVILSQSSVKNPHGQLPWDCQDCHTTESWSKMRDTLHFDHAATGYQLVGAHSAAQCVGCHKDMVFSHIGVSCIDCHADHHNGKLGADCQACHTPRDWQNRRNTLDLHSARGFALTGAHAVADCEACHTGHAQQEYVGTPVDCYDCHAEAYAATDEPNHAQAGFPLDCQSCHEASQASWRFADFNHPASFPLTAGHNSVACKECHPTGYAGTSAECYACHSVEFASTVDPNHETSGFTHECTLCHTTTAWEPAFYDHAATTFPLTGAHLQTPCLTCHVTQYAGTPTACFACHQTDFDQTTEPDHPLAQFDHDCTTCHTTTSWDPSSYDHASTGFSLTGQHTTIVCSQCHSTGFAGTAADCYACHQAAFEQVTDPNHVTNNFDHACNICHNTAAWMPAAFDHNTTAFPLTGQHVTASCIACHATQYAGTPSACFACHESAYQSTTSPNHVAAGFPNACQTCHATTGWTPANWDHDALYFPITSGAHSGIACNECHLNPSSFATFECTGCHEHNKLDTDTDHSEVGNYQYLSSACYTCHPQGRH